MQLHCRYHPTRVPVLMCSQCAVTVCPDCVPSWPEKGMPRCVSCRAEMEPLGISEYVKPFWQCFNRFFKFPFKAGNLQFVFLSVLILLIIPIPDAKELVTPLGFVFRIVVWLLFASFIVAYLSAVGIKGSDGNLEPPAVSEVWTDGGFLLFFKALIILFGFSTILKFALTLYGGNLFMVVFLLAAVALPATLTILFLEREISNAINPGRIIGLIQAIGWPYMFLCGLVIMLISGPQIVMSLPQKFLDSMIFPGLMLITNLYFGLVLFHMLGYVVFQYHFELGVSLPSEQIEGLRVKKTLQRAAILESELLIMDGKYGSAIQLLQKFISDLSKQDPKQDQVWLKLYDLARSVSKHQDYIDISEDYLQYLLFKQQSFKVVAVLRQMMQKTPQLKFCDFSSPDSLEKFLRDEKEIELLVQLL